MAIFIFYKQIHELDSRLELEQLEQQQYVMHCNGKFASLTKARNYCSLTYAIGDNVFEGYAIFQQMLQIGMPTSMDMLQFICRLMHF